MAPPTHKNRLQLKNSLYHLNSNEIIIGEILTQHNENDSKNYDKGHRYSFGLDSITKAICFIKVRSCYLGIHKLHCKEYFEHTQGRQI